jgi:Ala-tRNA(Pro) deacylase
MTVTTTVNRALDHVDYDLIEHRRTVTAAEEARAIGVRAEQIAKTIVLASDQRYIRAVLPASEHIDMHKVRRVPGDNRARFATECELAVAYPMYDGHLTTTVRKRVFVSPSVTSPRSSGV